MQGRLNKSLNSLLWFFLAGLLFVWFKGNFPAFKTIPVSPIIPFVLLASVIFAKLFFWLRRGGMKRMLPPRVDRVLITVLVLLLLAAGFRIPFLVYNHGLLTSDDAVPALMGKHISEGKLPPVYYYGQFYMGSLSEHFYALIFLLFGYSVSLFALSTLLFYFGFIVVQFVFLKEIFGFEFSVAASLFFCLPIGHLVSVSFDHTGAFSLVLLLGTLLVYLSYLISYKDRSGLIPILGFLMGLSFWTHQISIAFILTSLFVLVLKFRLRLKKYASLLIFTVIGCLPVLAHEIQEGFSLLKFLSPEESPTLGGGKMKRVIEIAGSLISHNKSVLPYAFLVLVILGVGVLVFDSVKKRGIVPKSLYAVFFIVFLSMYLLSDFSNVYVERYLYPLYFCLPILMISAFTFIRARIKHFFAIAIILSLSVVCNIKGYMWNCESNKTIDRHMRHVVETMEMTGRRYWQGNYWSAYLITALSNERIIVDSSTVNRYFPYRLDYYNQGENNNFVFLRSTGSNEAETAQKLIRLLDSLGVEYEKREIGESLLIFDVESTVFPPALRFPVPPGPPDFDLVEVESSYGYGLLTFRNNEPREDLRLRVHVEVPGYSSTVRTISWSREEIQVATPFPSRMPISVRFYFDYYGLKIPSSERERQYSFSEDELSDREEDLVFLQGVGPVRNMEGKDLRICEKEVRVEINQLLKEDSRIRLCLYSPFQFFHPYWYGEYDQEVRIAVNGILLKEERLADGNLCIEIPLEGIRLRKGSNILRLNFKYHLPFEFAPLWKTSALLDKIEII